MTSASGGAAGIACIRSKVVYLRERDLLPHLDDWLAQLFDPDNVDATCEAILGAAGEPTSSVERLAVTDRPHERDHKLDRYRELLEAGTDPAVVASWIKDVQTERSRAQATLDALEGAQRADINTAADVRDAVEHLGGLVGLLHVSEPKLRSRFYEEAGVLGTYLPDSRSVDIEADPCVRKVRSCRRGDGPLADTDRAWVSRPHVRCLIASPETTDPRSGLRNCPLARF